ncbi:MAG TPA: hypothetical protein VMX37_00295 [Acidimicrobiia bacterium]|nr:hypothetical protein [Acidimicrobiia bacterium]
MLTSPGRPITATTAAIGLLLVLAMISGCGDGSGTTPTQPTGTEDPASFAQAAEGPHHYFAHYEALCDAETGEDEELTFDITLGPDSLTLAAIDSWTMDFEQVSTNEYYRLEAGEDGIEWHKTLTLTADGFVLYSETNDPTLVGEGDGLQPCFRYTYTRLD